MKSFRSLKAAVTALALALGLGVVSSATANEDGPILVVSGPLSWPFFAAVKQGFDDGAETFGLDYQYIAVTDTSNMTSDYPRLLQQAISRSPRMLLVGAIFSGWYGPAYQ